MEEAEYCHRLALMHAGKIIAMGVPAELKSTLYSLALLYLETDELIKTMKLVHQEEGIREVAVFGAGLHVAADDAASATARIRATLSLHGVAIKRLDSIPPSMEDLFVSLIEAEERKTA